MPDLTPETAVRRCIKAYYDACDREDPQNLGLDESARHQVNLAYRHAMPFLTPDPDAIDAFIACVTHGLIFHVFSESEASKLLYAAQPAIASRRARLQSAKAHSSSAAQVQSPSPTPTPLAPEAQPVADPP